MKPFLDNVAKFWANWAYRPNKLLGICYLVYFQPNYHHLLSSLSIMKLAIKNLKNSHHASVVGAYTYVPVVRRSLLRVPALA